MPLKGAETRTTGPDRVPKGFHTGFTPAPVSAGSWWIGVSRAKWADAVKQANQRMNPHGSQGDMDRSQTS